MPGSERLRQVGQLRPAAGRRAASQDVLTVVEQIRVAGERGRVHLALIHGGGHRRAQQAAQREGLRIQRGDPAVGREFGDPDDVQAHDVIQAGLGLEVRHQLGELVIRLIGEGDDGDMLTWVGRVPLPDESG